MSLHARHFLLLGHNKLLVPLLTKLIKRNGDTVVLSSRYTVLQTASAVQELDRKVVALNSIPVTAS